MNPQLWGRLILILFMGGLSASYAQISLVDFPEDYQLYVRDTLTNQGTVHVSGTINQVIDTLTLQVTREGTPVQVFHLAMAFPQQVAFDFSVPIPAELAQYGFELHQGTTLTSASLLASAINVVAGDVILISGQSNAEAYMWNGSASEAADPFLRSFGSARESPTHSFVLDPTWGPANVNGNRNKNYAIGQWGARMGKNLIEELNIPIAVVNGARSGRRLSYFLRNDAYPEDSTTNYGRFLRRLRRGNLLEEARILLWYQGESDAISAGLSKPI